KMDLAPKERQELADLTKLRDENLKNVPTPVTAEIRDWEGRIVQVKPLGNDAAQLKRGRQFFTEKGCLACHLHEGTNKKDNDFEAVQSKANFAPNLSRVAVKLKAEHGGAEAGHRWLVQWLLNPNQHNPRTRMPI